MSCDPALKEYIPDINQINEEKEKKRNKEFEINPIKSIFIFDYPIIDYEAFSKLPGNGGIYNSRNLNLYCYAINNPLKYIDPSGETVYSVSLGADIFVGVGGKIEAALVWDDSGNWGISFTIGGGTGLQASVKIPGLKNIGKLIYEALSNSSIGRDKNADTIYDINGVSASNETSFVVGIKTDAETGDIKEINIGSIGFSEYAEGTIVIPISDAPKAVSSAVQAIIDKYIEQFKR